MASVQMPPAVPSGRQGSPQPPGVGAPSLFAGPASLRVPGEGRALVLSILLLPISVGLIGALFRSVTMSELALLVVAGMVYVSISRGRLLGASIRIDRRQFPEVFETVERTAKRLGLGLPQIFVRDDVFVPISAVGIGEPYSLIISSQYLEHLREGELAFLVARELGHIAAGHTRLTSLLSASGRENPAIALLFGAWLRRTEYTADRVGLLCGTSPDDAVGAIAITTFHAIGRRVDPKLLVEQQVELETDPTLRMGEWIAGVPYATKRITAIETFNTSPLAAFWRERLDAAPLVPVAVAEPVVPQEPPGTVKRRECAPVVRRAIAVGIDGLVVGAILANSNLIMVSTSDKEVKNALDIAHLHIVPWVAAGAGTMSLILGLMIYSAILVGLTGQTLGMMVMELRVVTTHHERPGIAQSIWRYVVGGVMMITQVAWVGFFLRIHPHDYASRTRLVGGRPPRLKKLPK